MKQTIPTQHKGSKTDTSHTRRLATPGQASAFFVQVRKRLLEIFNWDKLCEGVTAKFVLTDSQGNKVTRLANEGDHIQIDIPGPGSKTGDGYEWVRIESIREDKEAGHDFEQLSMTVRPASNPKNSDPQAAHFFNKSASSTFIVMRDRDTLRAEVHGRNELPNLKPGNFLDRIRNAVIALGAVVGLSSTQWKKLVKGLIDPARES